MNYLGHLYFSNNDKTLMLNNLFGDFVKGRDLSHFPKEMQKGILLHRKIDDFIDHFPEVNFLQQELYEELPKVSSVAIDLFFDHLLAKHWNDYHQTEINTYLEGFYKSVNLKNEFFTDKFKLMINKMLEVNWLSHYSSLDGLDKMCRGVSSRISFENKLKDGKEVYLKHEKSINQVFSVYMKAAILKFNIVV